MGDEDGVHSSVSEGLRSLSAEAAETGLLDQAKAYGKILVRNGELDHSVLGVFEHIGDSVIITEAEPFDEPGPKIVWVNRAVAEETGYSSAELIGETPRLLQGEESPREALDFLRHQLESWNTSEVVVRNRRKDGSYFWSHLSIVPAADESGWYTHWISIQRNVDALVSLNDTLKRDHDILESTLSSVSAGVVVADSNGRITLVNDAWKAACRARGNDQHFGLGLKYLDASCLALGRPDASAREALRKAVGENASATTHSTGADHRFGKSWYRVQVAALSSEQSDAPSGFVVTHTDVTQERELEQRLRHQSEHDELTGLLNRKGLKTRTAELSGHVLLLDLDRFKYVNDTLGHDAGDRLLAIAGRRLRETVGGEHIAARLGGDEFAVFVQSSYQQALELAQRVIIAFSQPFSVEGVSLGLGASIGIGAVETGGRIGGGLQRADAAMYEAKKSGRGQVYTFDDRLNRSAERSRALRGEIERVIAAGSVQAVYQPIMDLRTGKAESVEALMRLPLSAGDVLEPDAFLTVAKHTGQLPALGRSFRSRVFDTVADRSDLRVCVNLSRAEFTTLECERSLLEALQASGLAPNRVVVEVPEEAFLYDAEGTAKVLRTWRAAGVSIALDDFGKGHASLTMLSQQPLDPVKLDRCLLEEPGGMLLRAAIDSAHSLGLEVVVEGVETHDELGIIQGLRADYAQGYLFARPCRFDELDAGDEMPSALTTVA